MPGSGTCWCQDQEPAGAGSGTNICLGEVLALIRTMPADGLEPFDIYLLGIVRVGVGGEGKEKGGEGVK